MQQNLESEQYILYRNRISDCVLLILPKNLSRCDEKIHKLRLDFRTDQLQIHRDLGNEKRTVPCSPTHFSFRITTLVFLTPEQKTENIVQSSPYQIAEHAAIRDAFFVSFPQLPVDVIRMGKNKIDLFSYYDICHPGKNTARYFALINILYFSDYLIQQTALVPAIYTSGREISAFYYTLLKLYAHCTECQEIRGGRKGIYRIHNVSQFRFISPSKDLAEEILLEFDQLLIDMEENFGLGETTEYYDALTYLSDLLRPIVVIPTQRLNIVNGLRQLIKLLREHKIRALNLEKYGNNTFVYIEDLLAPRARKKLQESPLRHVKPRRT